VSEGVKISPEQVAKTVAELSKVSELVTRLGGLRTELHELLSRKYSVCRAQSTSDKLFYTFIVHLKGTEYVKEVSVTEGDIVMTNSRFTSVEFRPNKVIMRDKEGTPAKVFDLCNMSTSEVIELVVNTGKVIEAVKSELEPLIKKLEKFIEAVKTVVATLEMVARST
jgi:hypothetical protein